MSNYQTRLISFFAFLFFIVSCSNSKTESSEAKETKSTSSETPVATESKPASTATTSTAEDGSAIATIETSDYVLKIHKVVPFTLKPKSYEPIKVAADTKLAVLDISVRNKLSTPLNFSRILGMTQIKGKGDKNLMAPFVVAAYITDYPYPNHQKEYDALWNSSFEGNGFHRAMLFGLNPKKDENEFTLIVPEKADFNSSKKSAQFTVE